MGLIQSFPNDKTDYMLEIRKLSHSKIDIDEAAYLEAQSSCT